MLIGDYCWMGDPHEPIPYASIIQKFQETADTSRVLRDRYEIPSCGYRQLRALRCPRNVEFGELDVGLQLVPVVRP